jgi:hypothetical protein
MEPVENRQPVMPASARMRRSPEHPSVKAVSTVSSARPTASRLWQIRTLTSVSVSNNPAFDVRDALLRLLCCDVTQAHGLGPYLALKLVGECGTNLSAWPNAKHFTSWLCLSPSNKVSGGKILSSRTRRSGSRAAAAVAVGRTDTALGAFYRRLSARVGRAKAVTATARKIAVLCCNTLRYGMEYSDPGASHYEERYRRPRQSRAKGEIARVCPTGRSRARLCVS